MLFSEVREDLALLCILFHHLTYREAHSRGEHSIRFNEDLSKLFLDIAHKVNVKTLSVSKNVCYVFN